MKLSHRSDLSKTILLTIALALLGCNLTERTTSSAPADYSEYSELIQILQTEPGLQITNQGGTYEIVVRGAKSIEGENRPLYVLDGVPLGRDYESVNSTINIADVSSVRVLSVSMSGRYGNRGQNGVIEIQTKN